MIESKDTTINDDPKLAEIVARIVEAVHPTRIYLFGSRARGNCRPDSDYDVLILKEDTVGHKRRLILSEVRRSLWHIDRPIDLLLYTESEFSEWSDTPNHPLGRAARDGRLVYEAT